MAITIRTGANGSYKSSYVCHFVILPALKAGRVVVTNIEGMQPLEEIEKRLDITFPSTARLIRIFSRDKNGIDLWQHFFSWCPLGALIVIDECQDIFSKNIGFRMEKVSGRPLSDFLPNLPKDYEAFFHSRYLPVDMSQLDASEVDDRGQAEYDEQGRIIYPFSFNEGFMRHRKYNWDIELLSPDWGQIDTAIRACAEQCFFHKGNDGMFWARRKPYIYKHPKNTATPVIPKGKDPNVLSVKIPLEAFLLYKSTATGTAKQSGAVNVLYKNPKFLATFVIGIGCMGYFVYGLSGLVFGASEKDAQSSSSVVESQVSVSSTGVAKGGAQSGGNVSIGGNSGTSNTRAGDSVSLASNRLELIRQMLGLYEIQNLYYTGHVTQNSAKGFRFMVTLEANTPEGTYRFDDTFLRANNITYVHFDDCLLQLTKEAVQLNVFCKPKERDILQATPEQADIKLGSVF
ncbi:zonular occludens toxin domain-containing protein [Vibrio diazotrophicus]|uniref:Zona occludens toxin n=1 Tax=Vibrio diazotrophicus TaxID=685 RepID=A0A329DTP6_VIBDI|nr:zonular occludens toxin domain-containing protein [Vibrio diazotrophicus]RAS52748.1 zona occludens toxin [Vibrio diazotrophicus]